MQIGPRIRVGGSIGKLGEKLKHITGNVLAAGQTISVGGHKFNTSPLALLTSPLAKKLQGGTDSQAFHSDEDVLRSNLRSAGVAGGLMAGQAALPSLPGFGGTTAGGVGGSANAIADASQAAPAWMSGGANAAANAGAGAASGGFGSMSLADKLALASTFMNGIGGVAGGIAQGQQTDFENQKYKDRIAAMQRFRGGLQPPAPFQFNSPFAGMVGQAPQNPQNPLIGQRPFGPNVVNNGTDPRQPWTDILKARGMG